MSDIILDTLLKLLGVFLLSSAACCAWMLVMFTKEWLTKDPGGDS